MIHFSPRRLAVGLAGVACAVLMTATPALAAPAGVGKPSDAVTEDADHNDGGTPNNMVDDGDNAHPSGKDRSVEHGGSGNQGKSAADPDDDGRGPDRTNGGGDRPGGPGGRDLADQDGNNGCGNDDDFEDDNEGWCGKPAAGTGGTHRPSGTAQTAIAARGIPASTPVAGPPLAGALVAGPLVAAVPRAEPPVAPGALVLELELGRSADVPRPAAQVLGVSYSRAELARTGTSGLGQLFLSGTALVTLGLGARRRGRPRR